MNLSRGCRRFCRTTLNIVSVCFKPSMSNISTPRSAHGVPEFPNNNNNILSQIQAKSLICSHFQSFKCLPNLLSVD